MSFARSLWTVPLLAMGCLNGTAPVDDLRAARARWESSAVSANSYRLHQGIVCYCLTDVTRPKRLLVRNRTVVEARYADTGEPVPTEYVALLRTVDALFDEIAEALAAGAADVRVEYDTTLGYPREIYIDRQSNIADEEIGWTTRILAEGS